MVKRARELEMQYMYELKVPEDSDRDTCIAETGRPPIPADWVDIDDKGDSIRPNYCCTCSSVAAPGGWKDTTTAGITSIVENCTVIPKYGSVGMGVRHPRTAASDACG